MNEGILCDKGMIGCLEILSAIPLFCPSAVRCTKCTQCYFTLLSTDQELSPSDRPATAMRQGNNLILPTTGIKSLVLDKHLFGFMQMKELGKNKVKSLHI
jgi:hypothetical protein